MPGVRGATGKAGERRSGMGDGELVGPLARLEEGKRGGGRRRGSLGVEAVPVVHVWEDGLDGVELVCGGLTWGKTVDWM